MARLAKADVHAALQRAATHLKDAGGPDGIVSRKDARDKLLQLEGIERDLTDVFYRFLLARDNAQPARVTRKDVDAAVEYANAHIIDRCDLNRNGLSAKEIAEMSTTGKLAVALARQLKAAAAPSQGISGDALAKRIGQLTQGLILDDFGSEGSQDIFPAHRNAGLSQLTKDTIRQALGLVADKPENEIARFRPVTEEFYAGFVDYQTPDRQDEASALIEIFRKFLHDVSIVVVGRDDPGLVDPAHPAYVVGLSSDGDLVGFKSTVIWT